MRHVLRVAWYRFRATFGHRWGGLTAIVLLVGLIGGLAMGAVAAARRTQSAFPAYLARRPALRPHGLDRPRGFESREPDGFQPGARPENLAAAARRAVRSYAGPNGAVLAPDGGIAITLVGLPGSVDGEFFDQDRVTIVEGRMANPSRAGEVVMDAKNTPASVHVGTVFPLGFFTNAQEQRRDFGKARINPYLRIDVKVVGKAVFSKEVVQDDVAWQASIAVTLGVAAGVPLGIVVRRTLWEWFADAIHVVPAPTVPALSLALIAVGALVVANLVAALPGRQAARTRTAVLLHAE